LLVSFDGFSDGSNSAQANPLDAAVEEASPDVVDAPEAPSRGPFVVRTAVGKLRGIAVGGENLYWVEGTPGGDWGVYRTSTLEDAGAATEVGHGGDVFDVAVNADYAYWSDSGIVERAPLGDSSAAAPYLSAGSSARYLAVDAAGRVFVTADSAITAGPCATATTCTSADPVAGTSAFVLFPSVSGVGGIALGAGFLFWGQDAPAAVTRANTATLDAASNIDHQTPAPAPVSAVATDGTKVYWLAGDREILATPVSGEPDPPSIVYDGAGADAGFGPDADIAVDDEWVYFTRPSAGLILKYRKN
jgi:hypothetical protein